MWDSEIGETSLLGLPQTRSYHPNAGMKFLAATRSPFALMLSLVSFLLSIRSAGGSKHPVGVRLVFDDGKPPEGKICTPEEMKVVSHLLYERIERMLDREAKKGGVRHRSRRTQGNYDDYVFDDDATGVGNDDPHHCPDVCSAFTLGTCVIGYPECDDTRRLDATNVVKDADTNLLSKDFLLMCVSEEEAALDAIRGGVEGVSDSCNELLKDHVDVKCFELEPSFARDTDDDGDEVHEQSRSTSFLASLILMLALSTTALLMLVRQRPASMDDESIKRGNIDTFSTSAQIV